MPQRLGGANPKIGIRPVIDGRHNANTRLGLEDKTMGMALSAARLISENLRYAWGDPVECVVADTTIGGAAESGRCAEKFGAQNVCATLTVTPCWCYGSEVMDLDPMTIKAVWGFNGTERPGAVFLAAAMSAHAQNGLPAFSIYGRDVQDVEDDSIPDDVASKILSFARCAMVAGAMNGKSYLGLGSVSMGIASSFVNPEFLRNYLGVRPEWVDMSEVNRRMTYGIYAPEEFSRAVAWAKDNCKEGFDKNDPAARHSRAQKDAEWESVIKMAMICRDIMIGNPKLAILGFHEEALGHNAIFGGFQGQRQWSDWLSNADFTESILNSSFDWNGIREAFVFATENDYLNGTAMLFGHLLTGGASVFADVRTYWSPDAVKRVTGWTPDGLAKDGFIHLINSGSASVDGCGLQKDNDGNGCMKPYWKITPDEAKACMDAVRWCPADLGYFNGGGFSSLFRTAAEMPVTMARVNLVAGLGPVLQIAEGHTAVLPERVHEIIDKRTDPTWPTTWFVPRLTGEGAFADVYSVMANWGANHGAFSYGHIGGELVTLASMLRIPVSLHNIPAERLYRPHAWAAFGADDPTGADYRACAAYGPLYGKASI